MFDIVEQCVLDIIIHKHYCYLGATQIWWKFIGVLFNIQGKSQIIYVT